MPKKFGTENTKSVAARERKNAAKVAENLRKEKEKQDEYWRDDDKHINRKLQRKEEQERKKHELSQRKAELKTLVEQEEATLKPGTKQSSSKVTRAMIMEETERRNVAAAAAAAGKKKEPVTHLEKPLEENINRVQDDAIEARSVVEAIAVLSTKEFEEDKHPERRVKAAYAAFEETRLPIIKNQNPTLRLSQLKQILKKEWMKSPENPINQRVLP